MAGLSYVGAKPVGDLDITNRLAVNDLIATAATSATAVQGQINALTQLPTATYAPKTYVDSQDATFQLPSYYTAQDALNVPISSIGAANGVAPLDSNGDVPLINMPVLGAGYILGPYGPTAVGTGTTGATPLKIADWNIGNTALQFRALVFMSCFVTGLGAHPVIEVRIADSATAPTYAASTLVAMGEGRSIYNDYQAVTVLSVPDALGQTPSLLPSGYKAWLTAWVYDLNGQSVTLTGGNVAVASVFLLRGAL
jgi:hypothetical protein